jgi:hypothetical protein
MRNLSEAYSELLLGTRQMLLVYDHIITLDKEVRCLRPWFPYNFCINRSIGSGRSSSVFNTYGFALNSLSWRLRWRLPKILFLINRYFITSLVLYVVWIPSPYENNALLPQDGCFGQVLLFCIILQLHRLNIIVIANPIFPLSVNVGVLARRSSLWLLTWHLAKVVRLRCYLLLRIVSHMRIAYILIAATFTKTLCFCELLSAYMWSLIHAHAAGPSASKYFSLLRCLLCSSHASVFYVCFDGVKHLLLANYKKRLRWLSQGSGLPLM